jgi:hypothetical protein
VKLQPAKPKIAVTFYADIVKMDNRDLLAQKYIMSLKPALYLPLWKSDLAAFKSEDAYGRPYTNVGPAYRINGRYFDGIDDYLKDTNVGGPTNIIGNLSIFIWQYQAALNALTRNLIGNTRSNQYGYRLCIENKKVYMETNQAGTNQISSADLIIKAENWHCIGGVLKIPNVTILLDGRNRPLTSAAVHLAPASSTARLSLGVYAYSPTTQWFTGILGEAVIIPRPTSPEEYENYYALTKWRYR